MYTNGYVPPQEPRKRRTQHVSVQQHNPSGAPMNAPPPVRSTSSVQPGWQQPASAPQRPSRGVPQQAYQSRQAAPQAYQSQMAYQPQPQAYPSHPRPEQPYPPRPEQPYQPRQQSASAPIPAYQQPRQPGGAEPRRYDQQPGYQPRRNSAGEPRNYQQQGYRPPQQPAPAPQQQRRGGGRPPRKPGRILLIAVVAMLLIGAVAIGGMRYYRYDQVRQYVTSYNGVFCQGVYVDGIHLGGMTADEGVAAVTAKAQSRNDAWYVNLTYQGQNVTTLTASQLGMTVDVIDVLRQAWEQGHQGDIYQRKAAMEQLLDTPYQAYTAVPGGDTSVVDSVLQQIKNLVYAAPQDARLIDFSPANSYPFVFQDEIPGRMLNTEPLKETIYRMVSSMESGDVEIQPDLIQPTVTVADLKENLTMRASVYTPVSKDSTDNRTNNIRRSFQSISGYILEPGKKLSFNSVVGKRTLENGFFEAIEYAYGDEVIGVGGGVCQASTTLYQAAVVAGLEIVTREPHSDSVSYAAYGEDATVFWESGRKIDLVIKNNTDKPLYFVAAVQSDPSNRKRFIARVTIYGKSLGEGVRYELVSETTEVLKPPEQPEYIKDKKETYVTYTDQEHRVRKAKDGYVVDSYRLKYVNEQVVERTHLYTDRYEPKTERIYVGVKKRPTE